MQCLSMAWNICQVWQSDVGDKLQGTGAVNLVRARSQDSLTPIMLHKEVKRSVFIF